MPRSMPRSRSRLPRRLSGFDERRPVGSREYGDPGNPALAERGGPK